MEWDPELFLINARYYKYDGLVVTYTTDTPKNSYAKMNSNGFITEIKEKVVVSNIFSRKNVDFITYVFSLIILFQYRLLHLSFHGGPWIPMIQNKQVHHCFCDAQVLLVEFATASTVH